jgi:hypothetical protein
VATDLQKYASYVEELSLHTIKKTAAIKNTFMLQLKGDK